MHTSPTKRRGLEGGGGGERFAKIYGASRASKKREPGLPRTAKSARAFVHLWYNTLGGKATKTHSFMGKITSSTTTRKAHTGGGQEKTKGKKRAHKSSFLTFSPLFLN